MVLPLRSGGDEGGGVGDHGALTGLTDDDHPRYADLALFRPRVVGVTLDRWFMAGLVADAGGTSRVVAIDTLVAFPFYSVGAQTADRIAFNVPTGGGAGSVARAGIYQATSVTDPYPGTLVVDGGEHATNTTGVKSTVLAQALAANTLCWLAYLCGVAAPTISGITRGGAFPVFGRDSALSGFGVGWTVAQAYGALPDPFPAGGTVDTGVLLGIGVRFSA